jgi:hypothetical protein
MIVNYFILTENFVTLKSNKIPDKAHKKIMTGKKTK